MNKCNSHGKKWSKDCLECQQTQVAEMKRLLRALLTFNEELCDDVGVSKHYPSAEAARRFLDWEPVP